MKTDLFQSYGHCWVFQIWWHIECITFTTSSFRIWNSSIGIPSPPLALFVVIHTVKDFGIVNKAEVDIFLELSHFFDEPMDVGNLISDSFAFSKSSLNMWTDSHTVEAWLGEFWALFGSMWDECNCAVVWAFFGIAFVRGWNENYLFQSCGHCWVFQICWHI